MKKRKPKEDANQAAARIVGETIKRHEKPLPANFEAAWEEWSRNLPGVDARGMALLRAAFEAGAEVGARAVPTMRAS